MLRVVTVLYRYKIVVYRRICKDNNYVKAGIPVVTHTHTHTHIHTHGTPVSVPFTESPEVE